MKSLKEKRSIIKPVLHKLQRVFNISIAEIDYQDTWDRSLILCAMVSNDGSFLQSQGMQIINYIDANFRSIDLLSHKIEFI